MIRELVHFVRHAPEMGRLQARLDRASFHDVVSERFDAAGLREERRALVTQARGRVLEIGCGTGWTFPLYDPSVDLTAIEPDADFLAAARTRAARRRPEVTVSSGDATRLSFSDASFDAVVSSLVLCSVPSVEAVGRELHRVLVPGGALLALEHVRSEAPLAGALMHAFNSPWRWLNKQGCNMNRRPIADLERAGFVVEERREMQLFPEGPPAFPLVRARLRKPRPPVLDG